MRLKGLVGGAKRGVQGMSRCFSLKISVPEFCCFGGGKSREPSACAFRRRVTKLDTRDTSSLWSRHG